MTPTSGFRSAGMASACKEDVAEFIAAITAAAECGTGSSVKIVKYSIGRLEVAFAYDPEQTPSMTILRDEGGSLLIVDGTVYSWDRSSSSRESRFFDRSMFRKFEADPLRALRGIDAAATLIYVNARKNEIIVARDAIGNAPYYVNVEQDKVTWSPDLAAVCPEDFECRREAFDMYLASGYTLSPTSFIRQVDKLQAGTALIFSVGSGPRINRYENYAVPPAAALSHGNVVTEMTNRFPEALERRTPSSGRAV